MALTGAHRNPPEQLMDADWTLKQAYRERPSLGAAFAVIAILQQPVALC